MRTLLLPLVAQESTSAASRQRLVLAAACRLALFVIPSYLCVLSATEGEGILVCTLVRYLNNRKLLLEDSKFKAGILNVAKIRGTLEACSYWFDGKWKILETLVSMRILPRTPEFSGDINSRSSAGDLKEGKCFTDSLFFHFLPLSQLLFLFQFSSAGLPNSP